MTLGLSLLKAEGLPFFGSPDRPGWDSSQNGNLSGDGKVRSLVLFQILEFSAFRSGIRGAAGFLCGPLLCGRSFLLDLMYSAFMSGRNFECCAEPFQRLLRDRIFILHDVALLCPLC